MLPVLRVAGDVQEHRIGDVIEQLAKDFRLTDEERNQLLPSGKQTTFANRVHWARGYLVQAGLLEATKRAHFRITDRGRKALSEGLARIDNNYLSKFPEFIQFLGRSRGQKPLPPAPNEQPVESPRPPAAGEQPQTPDELLRSTVKQIEAALGKELLDRILAAPSDSPMADIGDLLDWDDNWIDAPSALTEVRNSLVHSSRKNREKLQRQKEALPAALEVFLWYIELALLKMFGHDGEYFNRISKDHKAYTLEFLPWFKKTK